MSAGLPVLTPLHPAASSRTDATVYAIVRSTREPGWREPGWRERCGSRWREQAATTAARHDDRGSARRRGRHPRPGRAVGALVTGAVAGAARTESPRCPSPPVLPTTLATAPARRRVRRRSTRRAARSAVSPTCRRSAYRPSAMSPTTACPHRYRAGPTETVTAVRSAQEMAKLMSRPRSISRAIRACTAPSVARPPPGGWGTSGGDQMIASTFTRRVVSGSGAGVFKDVSG